MNINYFVFYAGLELLEFGSIIKDGICEGVGQFYGQFKG